VPLGLSGGPASIAGERGGRVRRGAKGAASYDWPSLMAGRGAGVRRGRGFTTGFLRPAGLFVLATLVLLISFAGAIAFSLNSAPGRTGEATLAGIVSGGLNGAGFGLDQASVRGLRFASAGDVFEALKLDKNTSLIGFDVEAARLRIEALPWVRKAVISRILPGQLDISITERDPYAVWQRSDHHVLIDAEGRVLSNVAPDLAAGLPVVAGRGAAGEVAGLMAALSQHPELAKLFARADRIAKRRWRLRLTTGSVIELPAGEASAGLGRVVRSDFARSAISSGHTIVDVRAPDRIFTRSMDRPLSQDEGLAPSDQAADREAVSPANGRQGLTLEDLVREVM